MIRAKEAGGMGGQSRSFRACDVRLSATSQEVPLILGIRWAAQCVAPGRLFSGSNGR